jgi:hypothetical protein
LNIGSSRCSPFFSMHCSNQLAKVSLTFGNISCGTGLTFCWIHSFSCLGVIRWWENAFPLGEPHKKKSHLQTIKQSQGPMHVTKSRDQAIWEKHTQHSDALPNCTGSTLILLEPDIHMLTLQKLRNMESLQHCQLTCQINNYCTTICIQGEAGPIDYDCADSTPNNNHFCM